MINKAIAYYKKDDIWDTQFTAENKLQSEVIQFLNLMPHTVVVRQDSISRAGISDLIICHYGKFVAIELKDDEGTTSKQQDKFIRDIIKAGGKAAVCRTLSEVYSLLQGSM